MKLEKLIRLYRTDPVSGWHALRYSTRRNQGNLLDQIVRRYGRTDLRNINARKILKWHKRWTGKKGLKLYAGHAFVKKLRTVLGFGLTILENEECRRLRLVMSTMRFEAGKKRTKTLTAAQAVAIMLEAHRRGWHSIALAQAFQFELMLRQKDVIGEWVPKKESGESTVFYKKKKWHRGLLGCEIDRDLILRHVTSKKLKLIEADLKEAPMVMGELGRLLGHLPIGPLIVNEQTGLPYADWEFRRRWRVCARAVDVPDDVFEMDTRAGAITEAFDGEADQDFIRETAAHSDTATTQGYNRGSHLKKRSSVMQKRTEQRLKEPQWRGGLSSGRPWEQR